MPALPQALAGYPEWLVIAAAILVVLVALWFFGKVLKWTLSVILIVVAVGFVGYAAWLALNAMHLVPGPAPTH
jgi:hypothetical protein